MKIRLEKIKCKITQELSHLFLMRSTSKHLLNLGKRLKREISQLSANVWEFSLRVLHKFIRTTVHAEKKNNPYVSYATRPHSPLPHTEPSLCLWGTVSFSAFKYGSVFQMPPTSLWDGMCGSMQHEAVILVYNKFPISGTHSGTHQYMHLGKKIQCRLVGLTAQLLSTLNMKDTSMCLVHTPSQIQQLIRLGFWFVPH